MKRPTTGKRSPLVVEREGEEEEEEEGGDVGAGGEGRIKRGC